MSFKKKVELFWVPFEAKKILQSRIFFSDLFYVFFVFFFDTANLWQDFSSFFTSVLLDFTFSSSKFSSLSHSLFLLLSRFGGGGGGRFCPLWFEPSVVFSSLSSIRRLENE